MKQFLTTALALSLAVGGASAALAGKTAPAGKTSLATTRLKITGMHCEGCAMGVTRQLSKVKGVRNASVQASTKIGTVQYDPAQCKPATLVAAVKRAGYAASVTR